MTIKAVPDDADLTVVWWTKQTSTVPGRLLLSHAQMEAIVGREVQCTADDTDANRRAAPRVALGRRARLIRTSVSRRQWTRVMLHDISAKGIGFLAEVPMRPGETFALHLDDAAGNPLYFDCIARRCERGGIGGVWYVVGATFEATLDQPDVPDESPADAPGLLELALGRIVGWAGHVNPVRVLFSTFKRNDDYSSPRDTMWYRRR